MTQRRRWTWWKFVFLAIAGIVLLAFVGHATWNARERNVVAKRVAAIRAAGEPMEVGDFVYEPVPGKHDAAPLILAAAAALVSDPTWDERAADLTDADPHAFDAPLAGEPLELLRTKLNANAAALATIAPVDGRPDADFGVRMASPAINVLLPSLNKGRQVSNLLRTQALVAHHDRDAAAALDAVIDIDAVGSVMHKNPGLVSALVGSGICSMAAETTSELAPDLPVDDDATRARVKTLIGRFLNDALPREMFVNAILEERFSGYDTMECVTNGTLSLGQLTFSGTAPTSTSNGVQSVLLYVLRPVLRRGEWQTIDVNTEDLRLNRLANDYATYTANAGPVAAMRMNARSSLLSSFGTVMMVDLSRATLTRFRTTTDRHLAAVALAVRLYTLDHDGQFPPTLDALVPAYLPHVPTDAIDGKPIRYDPARKILWSVGDDERDDHGDETPPRPHQTDRWQTADNVVHLVRRLKPATQPTTASDD